MNNEHDLDYTTKIANFKSMTETGNDEIALDYLNKNDWDEGVSIIK